MADKTEPDTERSKAVSAAIVHALKLARESRHVLVKAIACGFDRPTPDMLRDLGELGQIHAGCVERVYISIDACEEILEGGELNDPIAAKTLSHMRAAIEEGCADAHASCPCSSCDDDRVLVVAWAKQAATPALADRLIQQGKLQDPAAPAPRLRAPRGGVFVGGNRKRLRRA